MHNGMIKVVTGIRRCGKSYLLFNIFYNYLLNSGVKEDHIIKIALDDRANKKYRNPDYLFEYIRKSISDEEQYYILLDEVQLVEEFEDVLNSFLHIKNVDTYVTGSNAKFLSKDIITEFRGRGDQIHLFPLSFAEFMSVSEKNVLESWNEYINFGGLPKVVEFDSEQDKASYLNSIIAETYLKDIKERNDIRSDAALDELLNILSSSIGSLTNPKKLSDTFRSVKKVSLHPNTIKDYLDYFVDSFLITRAQRYDIKGKKYINSPFKYYFTDVGLRNARLNFRQEEETHLMENIIFNELLTRGYNVDVGVASHYALNENHKSVLKRSEVNFVCNFIDKRYYIQVALSIPNQEKLDQEQKSLLTINDSFKKIIIVKNLTRSHYTDKGIYLLSLFDFLLNRDCFNS